LDSKTHTIGFYQFCSKPIKIGTGLWLLGAKSKKKEWNPLRQGIKIAVGILILGMLYYLVGFANLARELFKIQPAFIPSIIFWFLAGILLSAVNVFITTRPLRKISIRKAVQYYLYSWATGFFGLGKAGELSIIYWLKKENLSTGEATAIAIMDKFITFFTLVLLSAIGIWVFGIANAWQTIAIAVFLLAIAWFLLFTLSGRGLIKRMLRNYSHWFAGFGRQIKK